jgi:hypothetical protein
MPVKALPEGAVLERTTRERVVSANSREEAADKPWRTLEWSQYLAGLSEVEWRAQAVIAYLYRYDEKGNKYALAKYTTAIDEFKVQEDFGGGHFQILVKRGPQIIINEDFRVEGAQKAPATNGPSPNVGNMDANGQLVAMLREELRSMRDELKTVTASGVTSKAVEQAVGLSGQVFSSAVGAAQTTLANITGKSGGHEPGPMDELNKQLMQAMIAKLLNPADPIEQFAKMVSAMKGFNLGGGREGGGIAMELVRQVPNITNTLASGIREWRMAEEARARQVAGLRGGGQPPIQVAANPQPVQPGPQLAVMPAAQDPAMAPPAAPSNDQEVAFQMLEQGIANIVNNPALTVDEAANQACSLIDNLHPGTVDMMVGWGEEGILNLFRTRPILSQIPQNPRLAEFVKKFIEVARAAPVIAQGNEDAPPA